MEETDFREHISLFDRHASPTKNSAHDPLCSLSIADALFTDGSLPKSEIFSKVESSHCLLGIGCDILEIARFKEAVERSQGMLLSKICTVNEINSLISLKDPMPSYAARFAAKEALTKALGCGIGDCIGWHDMEIIKDEKGKPSVVWSKKALSLFPIDETFLSLSHSKTMALAFSIITKRKN